MTDKWHRWGPCGVPPGPSTRVASHRDRRCACDSRTVTSSVPRAGVIKTTKVSLSSPAQAASALPPNRPRVMVLCL